MYGMIVVTDPLEANLIAAANGVLLPGPADTMQLVLSDITVCKGVGSIDPTYLANYVDPTTDCRLADRPEWLSGCYMRRSGPTPQTLCELRAARRTTMAARLPLLTLPATSRALSGRSGRLTEGQTVLTNGVNVGGRLGNTGSAWCAGRGARASRRMSCQDRGSACRSSIAPTIRYFRLRLTTEAGGDRSDRWCESAVKAVYSTTPILEGGMIGTIDTGFDPGEILLPPASSCGRRRSHSRRGRYLSEPC